MQKVNLKKIVLSLIVFVAVFGLVGYLVKNRNKETIIDLGDGWKSYSHEEMGFTVKIPADAEIEFEVKGDKKDSPWASFSKGPIASMRALTSYGVDADNQEQINQFFKHTGFSTEDETNWKISKNGNRGRSFYKEANIKNKTVLIYLDEFENKEKSILKFQVKSVVVIGKTRKNTLFLDEDTFSTKMPMTQEHPHFTEDEIKEFIQKYTKLIDKYIISIDNF